MTPERLTQLITLNLAAMKTGSNIAAAAAEIRHDAHHPQHQAALDQNAETAQRWAARIDRALAEMGGEAAPVNHAVQTHYEVDKRLRGFATDDATRDLSIIGSGQWALHYWLAFFGTLRAYAAHAGRCQLAQDLQTSLDEAKRADEQYAAESTLSRRLLRRQCSSWMRNWNQRNPNS